MSSLFAFRLRLCRPKLTFVLQIVLVVSQLACQSPAESPVTSADDALRALRSGNQRFAGRHAMHPHESEARRIETADQGQHPFATVIACSDSRVPVEILFDQGIGDLFVIRVAGNVCGEDETGSIDYAVAHLDIPLVVLLGHEGCGAVTAVVDGAHEEGSLEKLLEHIGPAVEEARRSAPNATRKALISEAVRANVRHGMKDLIMHSPAVRMRLRDGRLQLVGAVYDIRGAGIDWLGPHPRQAELLKDDHNAVTENPVPRTPGFSD